MEKKIESYRLVTEEEILARDANNIRIKDMFGLKAVPRTLDFHSKGEFLDFETKISWKRRTVTLLYNSKALVPNFRTGKQKRFKPNTLTQVYLEIPFESFLEFEKYIKKLRDFKG